MSRFDEEHDPADDEEIECAYCGVVLNANDPRNVKEGDDLFCSAGCGDDYLEELDLRVDDDE